MLNFGFLFNFFSSYGQTFFISLLVPIWLVSFGLNNTQFGTIYTAITLLSALGLTISGKYIDRLSLKNFGLLVFSGLLLSLILLARAYALWSLITALFLVRFFGQGMMSHTASTGIAKHFSRTRGQALGITALGHPAGQFFFPLLLIPMISAFGWRLTLLSLAAGAAVLVIPSLWAVNKVSGFEPDLVDNIVQKASKGIEYLKTKEFWLIAVNSTTIPFICTAIFIYQYIIGAGKGWDPAWIALAFSFYAVFGALSLLISGYLVDRFGAIKLFAVYLLPALTAFVLIILTDALWVAPLFYGLLGVSTGLGTTINTSIKAEIFGTGDLGKIKSNMTALMVVSTALGPPLYGWLLDNNYSHDIIFGLSAVLVFLVVLLSLRLQLSARYSK